MRSSVGTALLSNIILLFVVVMLVFLVGSLSYTKAFRIKNNLINLIEREQKFDSSTEAKANLIFSQIGYRVVKTVSSPCKDTKESVTSTYPDGQLVSPSTMGKYRYCVYKYDMGITNASGKRKVTYVVTTYMYFDIPLMGSVFEFPIYGETKTLWVNP